MNQPGPIDRFAGEAAASLERGNFVRLVLSAPVSPDTGPKKILGRAVKLKGTMRLSLTLRFPTRDETKNLPVGETETWLRGELNHNFRSALLCTTARDWQFIAGANGAARLIDHKPSSKAAPSREHDRKRAGLLDASARDWLQGLGILDRDGRLRASMADKHRQVNRYLEIFSHLARECGWARPPGFDAANPAPTVDATTPDRKPALEFADMGCGKGYLTFGLWHLFHRVWKQPVNVIGVETRTELVAATNKLARQIRADGLEFRAGTIESAKLPRVDALIALHACDTATDDAIKRGIELGAKLIVVAPCCHQELRPQLGRPAPLAPVLMHGIMAERLAEWVTDGLRALHLEWAGYRTKVMEFVTGEHTPKNLMIAAVRERESFSDESVLRRIRELKAFFGIEHHALDSLLVAAGARTN